MHRLCEMSSNSRVLAQADYNCDSHKLEHKQVNMIQTLLQIRALKDQSALVNKISYAARVMMLSRECGSFCQGFMS